MLRGHYVPVFAMRQYRKALMEHKKYMQYLDICRRILCNYVCNCGVPRYVKATTPASATIRTCGIHAGLSCNFQKTGGYEQTEQKRDSTKHQSSGS
jgi:hypothetical protein